MSKETYGKAPKPLPGPVLGLLRRKKMQKTGGFGAAMPITPPAAPPLGR
jgi:hypothetical protein